MQWRHLCFKVVVGDQPGKQASGCSLALQQLLLARLSVCASCPLSPTLMHSRSLLRVHSRSCAHALICGAETEASNSLQTSAFTFLRPHTILIFARFPSPELCYILIHDQRIIVVFLHSKQRTETCPLLLIATERAEFGQS